MEGIDLLINILIILCSCLFVVGFLIGLRIGESRNKGLNMAKSRSRFAFGK